MTLFFFNCDNSTQSKVLEECGVKNVSVSYKFVKKNISDFKRKFLTVLLNPGAGKRNFEAETYYQFVKEQQENYDFALQFDEPGEIRRTMSYYHIALERNLDWIIPILHEDYEVALNYIKPILKGNMIALGQGKDREAEDDSYQAITGQYNIHGLAKARWLKQKNKPFSVDSSTWLNPVRNGKIQIYTRDGKEEVSVRDVRAIMDSMEENKDFVEKCGLKMTGIATKDHASFLKASIVLNYLPMFKELGITSENIQ